jgi:hypothetical protein
MMIVRDAANMPPTPWQTEINSVNRSPMRFPLAARECLEAAHCSR